MGLEQELADLKAAFEQKAPAERVTLYATKIEELRARFAFDQARKAEDRAPGFALPDTHGRTVSLGEVLRQGPAVITFYRGGWCPYCNLQLRAYQQVLPEMKALGVRLLAISPQRPDGSLSTAEKNALAFDVLSDAGNQVARSFGLVYALAPELRQAMSGNGVSLPTVNGDESWELPAPATFVVAPDGRIALAYVEVDYRKRLPPENILAALRALPRSSHAA